MNINEKSQCRHKEAESAGIALKVISLVFCFLFGIFTICNVILIVKGKVNPYEPASLCGYCPVIVNSDAMEGNSVDCVFSGDFAFIEKIDFNDRKSDDVLVYRAGDRLVLGRIVGRYESNGVTYYNVKGDNMENIYYHSLTEENFFGKIGWVIPKLGYIANFIMSPLGLVLFVLIPFMACCWIICVEIRDIIRIKKLMKTENDNLNI